MAKSKNGNKTWIFGAVMGAVAGAAYALWKTPMSGEELRSKLSTGPVNQNETTVSESAHTPGVGEKLLSKVEHTLAPIVGVELGKTANATNSNGVAGQQSAPTSVKTAPAATASNPAATAAPAAANTSGTDSIRAKRFAWGDPVPEAEVAVEAPVAPAEPVVAAPIVPPAQAAVVETPADTSHYGAESIRAKRFAWGDPAPENGTASTGTVGSGQETAPIAAAPAATTTATANPVEAVSDSAATPGSNMRKFPQLGGLE